MTVKPVSGFKSLETHHCITGSILHIYKAYKLDISEDMLLGLGSGMGFIYWHIKVRHLSLADGLTSNALVSKV